MTTYTVESELSTPKPRRIHRRDGASKSDGSMRFVIVLHALAGGVLASWALFAIAVSLFGSVYPATVTRYSSTRSGMKTLSYLEYSYVVGGRTFNKKTKIPGSYFGAMPVGGALQVRVLKALPATGEQIVLAGRSRFSPLIFPLMFAVIWNIFTGFFLMTLWNKPVINRRLVENGTPTMGRITDKKTVRGKGMIYIVHYEFAPIEHAQNSSGAFDAAAKPLTAPTLQGRNNVSPEHYQQAEIGQAATVLFDENKPQHSVLYPFAEWEAEK